MSVLEIDVDTKIAPCYRVHIDTNLLERIGPAVRQAAPAPVCGLVTDRHVARYYLRGVRQSLAQAGYRVAEFIFPPGERYKKLATVAQAYDALLAARLERTSPILALGGGVVGDLAGFVAATLLRGLPLIQIPTTLLAAVDASVGGKVGVDHTRGKNLIGAFHQPRAVFADVAVLASLPEVELQCGLAECVKHAVIRDQALFEFIADHLPAILRRDPPTLLELIARNVRIKAAVVTEDPFEQGVRALLNFGHTFGHALETVGGYGELRHGQAVALGMVAAARLAVSRRLFPAADAGRLQILLKRIGLPICQRRLDISAVLAAMQTDKKIHRGALRFILPVALGRAEIFADVTAAEIRAALATLDCAKDPRPSLRTRKNRAYR